jgi:class 3 adenylate cyclase/tetratricopeptide (TPR) repeat protein
MQCPRCRHDNPVRAKFCLECGTRLALTCSQCSTELPPSAKFCLECGHPAGAGVPPLTSAPPASTVPAPAAYTPPHLAERIISSRAALEGERKQVTVLFADLKGSMELLADRDPEEARAILDPVLERMMEAVHRYEGTVNQVMGDGIMALFGAPLAHEDHAVRACYAALRMQDAVRQLANEAWHTAGVRVQIRVGLNSGEVVVRSIGSDLHMDYTAVGQTTHLAARMEQVATPGSILLAPDTLQLVEGYVQVKPLGPVQVKGLNDPIPAYELVGAGTARTRLEAAAARGLTKFVGRDTELETLRRTLEQVGSGHGQVVALVGEPGVGKSRLVWEFSHSHRTQGWLVLDSRSVSYGKATTYLPVIELLKTYCGIEARDDHQRMREKLTGKLLTLDPELHSMLPVFLALLDVPVADANWTALDPSRRRRRTLDACKRLLLRESQRQPLLLVFEDLHWIDAETQALLDSLVDSLPTARLLLLVNYRPEYDHAWHRKTYYQQLRLDPLSAASAEELLHSLLGTDASLCGLRALLIQRTQGNPFFLEESARALVESGQLIGERGSYRLAKPLEATQVPASVQAVLAARIDRLAPEDKRLLQSAAVIGKDVPYALLEMIADVPELELREGLTRLQAAEFLYETSLFPELEYTFKHALTHEVAYNSLLGERRRALHARIAEAMETLFAERLAEHVEHLANHAYRGELWEKAVVYLRQAGAKARARSAHREAVTYLEEAIAATEHLPDSRTNYERAIDIRLELRNPMLFLSQLDRLHTHLRVAESLAKSLGDERRLGWVDVQMLLCLWASGERQRAVELGERAFAMGVALGDRAIQAQARHRVIQALYCLGRYRQVLDWARDRISGADGTPPHETFGMAGPSAVLDTNYMIGALAELGEFGEGATLAESAIQVADEARHPFGRISALRLTGHLHLRQGNFGAASRFLASAQTIAESFEITMLTPAVLAQLGYAYVLDGRVGDGLALLERVWTQVNFPGSQAEEPLPLAELGEAYLLADQPAEAARVVERALVLAQERHERGYEAWLRRLQGEIAALPDPPDIEHAETHYHQALALAEELGMRPLVAHCHLGLGTLYRRVGRDEQAQAELTTAAEMYRAMEMPFWLERAEAELGKIASALDSFSAPPDGGGRL